MNIDQAFPSKYLRADDMGQEDETYTIDRVEMGTVGSGDEAETKPIVFFRETEKGLALNKTNSNTIKGLYGADTDDWSGKPVTLFVTEVDYQGKQVLAIRVRMRAPKPAPRQAAAPTSTGNGAAIPAADAAKRAAWDAFKLTMPGQPNEVVANDWKTAVTNYLPSKAVTLWTVADWKKFQADNFLPRQSPISDEQIFVGDDSVPF